jgi:uncharacterized membrane protein
VVNPPPDFGLSGSPASQTVAASGSTSYGVTINPANGFAGAVTLSVSGLPTGATGNFNTNPATTSSTLAVTTSASTPTGTYTLSITGVSGSLTHTATVTLVVTAAPDFALSGSPASQTVAASGSTSYGVTINPANGFAGAVTLSVSGLPTGATGNFNTNPATTSSTLAVTTSASTPTGTYTLTITGVSGSLTHTATVTLVVTAAPDFALSGSPASQTVSSGASTSYGVTISPTNGFAGAVTLSVSGLPTGATGSFNPNPATTTSTLSVTTSASTPAGTYTLTITGVSGSLTHTASVTLVVNGDFGLTGSPASQTVLPGNSTTYGVTINPTGGFAGSVTLSVSGLPTGATGSFSPNPATTTSTLSVTTSASTPTGTYTLTITGVSGALTHTTTVTLVVSASMVTVTAPNTAVTWQSGTTQNVTFTHNLGVGQQMNIDVSRDGGTTWAPVGSMTTTSATTGTYPWAVTGPSTTLARIRVTAASTGASDISNVNFTISSAITVTAPNTAVTWAAGSTRTVTWTHSLGAAQAFDVDFSPDNGVTWVSMAIGVPAATSTTGTYTGLMPTTVTTQALVRVSPTRVPVNGDTSNVVFTLAAPTVTVTAPNTNVNWTIGSAQNVTWSHNLGTSENVQIEVSRDGGTTWSVVTASQPNSANTSGTFSWTVTGPATTSARMRVTWTRNGTVQDISNVNFQISSPIAVTAPNTAVTWAAGSTRTVTWTHSLGAAQTFDVDFSADNGVTWTSLATGVLAATSTTGTYTGLMPTTLTTQAVVRVSPTGLPINGDISNVVFSLVAPAITVTAPNTNVNWATGSSKNVTWSHNLGTLENVLIEVSRDGGSTWSVLTASQPNSGNTSGTFSWTVTGPATTSGRIRVTWTRNSSVQDISDVNFRIQ